MPDHEKLHQSESDGENVINCNPIPDGLNQKQKGVKISEYESNASGAKEGMGCLLKIFLWLLAIVAFAIISIIIICSNSTLGFR